MLDIGVLLECVEDFIHERVEFMLRNAQFGRVHIRPFKVDEVGREAQQGIDVA